MPRLWGTLWPSLPRLEILADDTDPAPQQFGMTCVGGTTLRVCGLALGQTLSPGSDVGCKSGGPFVYYDYSSDDDCVPIEINAAAARATPPASAPASDLGAWDATLLRYPSPTGPDSGSTKHRDYLCSQRWRRRCIPALASLRPVESRQPDVTSSHLSTAEAMHEVARIKKPRLCACNVCVRRAAKVRSGALRGRRSFFVYALCFFARVKFLRLLSGASRLRREAGRATAGHTMALLKGAGSLPRHGRPAAGEPGSPPLTALLRAAGRLQAGVGGVGGSGGSGGVQHNTEGADDRFAGGKRGTAVRLPGRAELAKASQRTLQARHRSGRPAPAASAPITAVATVFARSSHPKTRASSVLGQPMSAIDASASLKQTDVMQSHCTLLRNLAGRVALYLSMKQADPSLCRTAAAPPGSPSRRRSRRHRMHAPGKNIPRAIVGPVSDCAPQAPELCRDDDVDAGRRTFFPPTPPPLCGDDAAPPVTPPHRRTSRTGSVVSLAGLPIVGGLNTSGGSMVFSAGRPSSVTAPPLGGAEADAPTPPPRMLRDSLRRRTQHESPADTTLLPACPPRMDEAPPPQ